MRLPVLVVLLLTAGVSCRFDATLPPGLTLTCAKHEDCPASLRCQLPRGFCVEPEVLDVDPPRVTRVTAKISPAPGNPLAAPTRLTLGSTLELALTVNEQLGKSPELSSPALACAELRSAELEWTYLCVVIPNPPQGPAEVRAVLEDEVGLVTDAALPIDPPAVIDTVPPPDPLTGTPGLIVYERAPLGTDASGGLPRFTVTGGPGAAPEAIELRVRSTPFPRGTSPVDTQGAFGPVELVPLDSEQVEVSSIDEAGNTSAWVKVLDGRWLATLVGKVAGSTRKNPHRLDTVGAHGAGAFRPDGLEHDDSEGLGAKGGEAVRVTGLGTWARYGGIASSSGAPAIATTWDVQRAKAVVLFEDLSTAEMTGRGWMIPRLGDPENDGQPAQRKAAMAVYDERAGRTLLIGGYSLVNGFANQADLWAYDGRSWRRLGDAPPVWGGAAVYDPVSHRTIVAAGWAGTLQDGGATASTFVYEGGAWLELPQSLPSARYRWAMATDRRGQVLGFGGTGVSGTVLGDVLSFDGQRWQSSPSAGLPPRTEAALLWDEAAGRWLVWGGLQADGGTALDGYERRPDAGSWTKLSAAALAPLRSLAVYDPVHRQVLAPITPGAALAFDGTRWGVQAFGTSGRQGNTLACPLDGGCLLVRGVGVQPLGETLWGNATAITSTFDGGATVAAWDDERSELVVATATRTFRWSGSQPAAEVAAGPGAWVYADLAPQANGLLFLSSAGATRQWSGTTWVDLGTSPYVSDFVTLDDLGPGAAIAHVVRFGGSGCTNTTPTSVQTLSRDAGQWADTPELVPRQLSTVAWDPVRSRSYSFGGVLPGMALEATDELWELGDGGWRRLALSDAEGDLGPSARTFGQLGFDADRRVGVLLGGATAVGSLDLDDTWLLSFADERPAAYFTVEVAEANLPAGWVPLAVQLSAQAGATSQSKAGQPVAGARALVFTRRVWTDITTANGGTAALPGPVTGALGELTEVPWRDELQFALVPEGTNGDGTAELSVDYVEVRLDYRLPP